MASWNVGGPKIGFPLRSESIARQVISARTTSSKRPKITLAARYVITATAENGPTRLLISSRS
jgi:hypothetical protein